jgi:hypothetical protein
MGLIGLFCSLALLSTLGIGQAPDDGDRLHADDLIRVLEERLKDDAAMKEEALWEALADAFMLRRTFARTPEERQDFARKADRIYPRLATQLGSPSWGEKTYRVLWKHARALSEFDPEALRQFFKNATVRGYAPKWDEDENGKSRWGYRDRLEALRPKP